jgi:hypothetical protein
MDAFEPIEKEHQEEWDDIIAKSKLAVKRKNGAQFELIYQVARLKLIHGEGTLRRWAEEIGIGYPTAREYQYLANKGVDQAFVKKYGELGYTVIFEIASFNGGLGERAEYWLAYAKKHQTGPIAIRALMNDMIAPPKHREDAASHKLAIRVKQENDGFGDVVRNLMEQVVEEHPEYADEIMKQRVVTVEDFEKVLIQAGVKSEHEQRMVDKAKIMLKRLRKEFTWATQNELDIIEQIEYGHEISDELKDRIKYLRDLYNKFLEHNPKTANFLPEDVVDLELGPKPKPQLTVVPDEPAKPAKKAPAKAKAAAKKSPK